MYVCAALEAHTQVDVFDVGGDNGHWQPIMRFTPRTQAERIEEQVCGAAALSRLAALMAVPHASPPTYTHKPTHMRAHRIASLARAHTHTHIQRERERGGGGSG